jgi:hypothetical protein
MGSVPSAVACIQGIVRVFVFVCVCVCVSACVCVSVDIFTGYCAALLSPSIRQTDREKDRQINRMMD